MRMTHRSEYTEAHTQAPRCVKSSEKTYARIYTGQKQANAIDSTLNSLSNDHVILRTLTQGSGTWLGDQKAPCLHPSVLSSQRKLNGVFSGYLDALNEESAPHRFSIPLQIVSPKDAFESAMQICDPWPSTEFWDSRSIWRKPGSICSGVSPRHPERPGGVPQRSIHFPHRF